jgi:hypothetical protein
MNENYKKKGGEMAQDSIVCPKCGEVIRISQIISQSIEEEIRHKYEKNFADWKSKERETIKDQIMKEARGAFEKKIEEMKKDSEAKDNKIKENKEKEIELEKKIAGSKENERKLAREFEARETELRKEIDQERQSIKEKERKKVEESVKIELEDLKTCLKEKEEKLEKAEAEEIELRRRQRELEESKKRLELETMRKLDQERPQIEEKAKQQVEESHRLRDLEKDKQLNDMRNQIEELKRKAEQGSEKTQGEVLEIEVEKLLKEEFPFDEINPVASGIKGGDIIQIVKTQSAHICGKILWESKRTKNWSDSWIQKLRDDQREAKADLAVIVSEVLPKGFHHFRQIEGVWVADLPSTLSLALALRTLLIQVARTCDIQTGKEEKMEVVYNYLTGFEFRNRVQAIMEAFVGMKKDLDSEKRAMESIWAKREKQIGRVVTNIAGMRGDLEGIVGLSLPTIKLLELPSEKEVLPPGDDKAL